MQNSGIPPSAATSTLPLANLRIVDFGWAAAGPQATRILGDFGAEVIKIESKARPDACRTAFGPFFANKRGINRSGYFHNFNRNKLSITLNLTTSEARAIVARLIRISDVVLDNFTPGVLARWGLGYEEMCRLRPGIIYIGMSGFGPNGPYSGYRSFGPTAQAVSGLTHLNGLPGQPPCGWGYSYMDHTAGYLGAISVLAAYYNSLATGMGQSIDLPQVEGSIFLSGTAVLEKQANGRDSAPVGNKPPYPLLAPQGVYRCKGQDRWLALTVRTEAEWEAFCRVIARPELSADSRFASAEARRQQEAELDRQIEAWTSQQEAHAAMEGLQAAGIAAGVVQNAADIWEDDPQIQHLGLKVPMEHPEVGLAPIEGMPIRLSEARAHYWRHGPLLGQDNDYVFHELLGLEPDEIAQMVETGVIS